MHSSTTTYQSLANSVTLFRLGRRLIVSNPSHLATVCICKSYPGVITTTIIGTVLEAYLYTYSVVL